MRSHAGHSLALYACTWAGSIVLLFTFRSSGHQVGSLAVGVAPI